jgi:hypothetical protein
MCAEHSLVLPGWTPFAMQSELSVGGGAWGVNDGGLGGARNGGTENRKPGRAKPGSGTAGAEGLHSKNEFSLDLALVAPLNKIIQAGVALEAVEMPPMFMMLRLITEALWQPDLSTYNT